MPAKNTIKEYQGDGYYHIYNRGINKGTIFFDEQDCRVFLSYLKTYLLPKDQKQLLAIIQNPEVSYAQRHAAEHELALDNFFNRISLLAYSLMPNHFHMLVHQRAERDIVGFMRALVVRQTSYINRRHKRVGPLLQGEYRAVLVRSDEQLMYLTRYIHRNSFSLKRSDLFELPSSYPNYLGVIHQEWVKPDMVLSHFTNTGYTSYKHFVEDNDDGLEGKSGKILKNLTLDQ